MHFRMLLCSLLVSTVSGCGNPTADADNGTDKEGVFSTVIQDPIKVNFFCQEKGRTKPLKLNLYFKGDGNIRVTEHASGIRTQGSYKIVEKNVHISLPAYPLNVQSTETEMQGGILVRMEANGFICHAVAHEHDPPKLAGRYRCDIFGNEHVVFDFGLVGNGSAPVYGSVFRSHQFNLTNRYERAHGIVYKNGDQYDLVFADLKDTRRLLKARIQGNNLSIEGYKPALTQSCKKI